MARTLFQDTHIPLNLWFRAVWYVTEQPKKVLAVAVEINNKKIGRISAKIIDNTDLESMSDFIRNCVEAGSNIVSSHWDGRDEMMNQRYAYEAKLETYKFPYAEKVFRLFRDKLWHLSNASNYYARQIHPSAEQNRCMMQILGRPQK